MDVNYFANDGPQRNPRTLPVEGWVSVEFSVATTNRPLHKPVFLWRIHFTMEPDETAQPRLAALPCFLATSL